LIPGLGSSPTGASYSYRDMGLLDGQTYHYKLEDVEATGKTGLHGPVSATPMTGSVAAAAAPASARGSPTGSRKGRSSVSWSAARATRWWSF
jgi:hypothetical protein